MIACITCGVTFYLEVRLNTSMQDINKIQNYLKIKYRTILEKPLSQSAAYIAFCIYHCEVYTYICLNTHYIYSNIGNINL